MELLVGCWLLVGGLPSGGSNGGPLVSLVGGSLELDLTFACCIKGGAFGPLTRAHKLQEDHPAYNALGV